MLSVFATLAFSAFMQSGDPVTSPGASIGATSSPSPTTAPASTMGHIQDFGVLDVEMTLVSDFGELDLAKLLDAEVETASKKSEPISKAPAIIEVLTRQQLYDLGARDLYSALTYLPGVELVESYLGYTTFIFRGQLQEIYNPKILLLINGRPTYEVVNYQFYSEMIPFESIDRIEVIRGPGSVLYGTNAFAGVINVITRTQREAGNTTAARADGGSFSSFSGSAGNFGKAGDLSWSIFAGGNYTKGYPYVVEKNQNEDCVLPPSTATVPKSEVDKYCAGAGPSGTLDYFNNYASGFGDILYKGLRLQAGGMTQEKMKYGIIPNMRLGGPNSAKHVFADLSYRRDFTEDFSILVRGGLDQGTRTWEMGKFPYPSFPPTHVDNDSRLLRGELASTWFPVKPVQLDFGLNYERTSISYFEVRLEDNSMHFLSPRFDAAKPPYQMSLSGFAQGTWRLDEQLTLIAGNRITRFVSTRGEAKLSGGAPISMTAMDDPQLNYSPRGGLVYAPRENLAFKFLYGAAFRNPTVYETTAILSQIVGTTKGIKPETIRTAELGVDSRPIDRMSLRVNGYYSKTADRIGRRNPTALEAQLFGAQSTVYDNLAGETIAGVEASVQAILTEEWRLFANGAWKEVVSHQTDKMVREVAPFTGNGGFSYKPLNWLVINPNVQYFGPRKPSKAYTLVNAVVDFPVYEWLTLSVIGNNVLDQKYDYPEYIRPVIGTLPGGPGRAFYGRMIVEF